MLLRLLHQTPRRVMLLLDWVTRPAPIKRSDSERRELARQTRGLALYDCKACPDCIRTRRAIHQLALPLERRDIGKSQIFRDDLLAGIGTIRTPCLRVEHQGQVRWIQDGDEIIRYLNRRFGPAQHQHAA